MGSLVDGQLNPDQTALIADKIPRICSRHCICPPIYICCWKARSLSLPAGTFSLLTKENLVWVGQISMLVFAGSISMCVYIYICVNQYAYVYIYIYYNSYSYNYNNHTIYIYASNFNLYMYIHI